MIVGGEELKRDLAAEIYEMFAGNIEIYNEYGPTETVVGCMIYKFDYEKELSVSVPIGTPADNVQIYLLDEGLKPVASGVVGEIYISGDGVARGYLNREDLTKERFIQNPFMINQSGSRMYKTGDLARMLPTGNIEFIGRIDNQVKVRGFRIEPGEIEGKLLSHDAVKEAIVIDWKDKNENIHLTAYIVSDTELSTSELKKYLSDKLPEYMLPAYFMQLDAFPLTPNGKIDRQALPDPVEVRNSEGVAPRNAVEEKLLKIWEEVLGREGFGITDEFFDLGGHSLTAIRLLSMIQKELNVEITLMEVFKSPTIAELAEIVASKKESIYSTIEPVEKQDYYLASSAQKRLFVLHQLDKTDLSYNMPIVRIVEGEVDHIQLEMALNELIKRHETLRTSFELIDGATVQRVHEKINLKINYSDLSYQKDLDQIVKDFIRPFDLSQAPLLRVGVVRFKEQHLLMMDMHHIISDGVAMSIFFSELMRLYQGQQLPDLRIQYKDFAVWQNQLLESDEMKKQENYWLSIFEEEARNNTIPVLNLPIDYTRGSDINSAGDNVRFRIDKELTEKLTALAKENGATLNMTLLAIYYVFLAKYTGQDDIIVGTPIAGRNHLDLENIIGMFVNTLAMRSYLEDEKTFGEFLLDVKEDALRAYQNQDYQFEMLVDKLKLQRDLSRNPLFDVLFDIHTIEKGIQLEHDLKIKPYKFKNKTAKFDLSLEGSISENVINLVFGYATNLFRETTVERMAQHFINIIDEVTSNPKIKIAEIEIVSREEKEYLIYGLNHKKYDFPRELTIYQRFEREFEQHPSKLALYFEGEEVSYQQLNERANQLARVLQKRGIYNDRLVGILLDRSPLMVESILAVWKAGGAYIPIDPNYPVQRIKEILADSEATLLLTDTNYIDNELEEAVGDLIFELDIHQSDIIKESGTNLDLEVNVDSLAYVIYTSGSTGKPKGAMVEQIGMHNHIQAKINDLELTAECVVAQNASHCFDISVWQFFVALTVGGKTVIYPNELTMNPEEFIDRVIADQNTILEVVPSFLSVMLDSLEREFRPFELINYLLVTGETVKPNLVKRWFALYPDIKMVNAYGPTEASDDITHHIMDQAPDRESIPIGRPLENFHIYIVDKNMNLCPIGVKGEICVSGVGVGRGYLNNAEKTKAVFMEDPFVEEKGVRLYKTGDLGRWLDDGSIEFFGRKDYQVKIRGFRIELGEIESKLVEHTKIKEAVVLDKEDGSGTKYLCAYIVNNGEVSVLEIRKYLSEVLPEYMVPAHFVYLEKMPLSSNGKINRKALPEVDGNIQIGTEYLAPKNLIEMRLVKIWSEILGIEKIGVDDNFFELGGHSLKATQVTAKVFKELNVELPLREIFKTPTIKELADFINKLDKSIYTSIDVAAEQEYYPVSSAQKRIFLLCQLEGESTTYNMPASWLVEGEFDLERANNAIQLLISRHESLRTSFEFIDEKVVQKVHQNVDFDIEYFEEEEAEFKQVLKNFVKPFNLSKAPLLRVGIAKSADKHLLLMDVHHIISDGLSMGILFKEFFALYEGIELPEQRIQYKDYAVWQEEFLRSKRMQGQEKYWLDTFSGEIPVLNLETDYERPAVTNFEGDKVKFEIGEEITAKLNELTANNGVTMFMVLLSVYNILLSKYANQEDIVVGVPIAGRPHDDLENMIGMFVNTLAMKNYPENKKTFAEFLTEVKDNSLMSYENQEYQFEMLVDQLNLQHDPGRNPLFDTTFTLQNLRDDRELNDVKIDNLRFRPYGVGLSKAKFDLTLVGMEIDQKIKFVFEYKTKLFKNETIEQMSKNLLRILEIVADNPGIKLSDISLESRFERLKSSGIDDIDFDF